MSFAGGLRHLVCDGNGRALAWTITGGNARRGPERALTEKGSPRRRNGNGCDHYGIKATIPERKDQIEHRRKQPGRPIDFGNVQRERYRGRNMVERCSNKLKQWRGFVARSGKTASSYHAGICLATKLQWV